MKYFDVNFAYYHYVYMKCVYGFPHLTSENAMNTAFVFTTTGGISKDSDDVLIQKSGDIVLQNCPFLF